MQDCQGNQRGFRAALTGQGRGALGAAAILLLPGEQSKGENRDNVCTTQAGEKPEPGMETKPGLWGNSVRGKGRVGFSALLLCWGNGFIQTPSNTCRTPLPQGLGAGGSSLQSSTSRALLPSGGRRGSTGFSAEQNLGVFSKVA